jgi:hypothetical protein
MTGMPVCSEMGRGFHGNRIVLVVKEVLVFILQGLYKFVVCGHHGSEHVFEAFVTEDRDARKMELCKMLL